ncbi:S28 family serine protease [Apibacter sp. HY039]|uniref:S28 family serine protease n=1 Tax=Apibacter sp. HY039 TaxID=2501476 RepID=UPI000FEBD131|nr:S28 family serine protease [Apibacter sp. HY039]
MKKMKSKWVLVLIGLITYMVGAQTTDDKIIQEFLSGQQEVSFKKLSMENEYPIKYELKIKQPLDWKNPGKGSFYQKVIYTHTGFNNPVVMETQGYDMYDRKNELQQITHSNDINIEHRYFGESVPDSLHFDWKYLNLYNATHDLHHINQIFKKMYKGKWISTGISKGGQTTIYYRYFFPDDVDVSVPYVAPINYSLEDPRIYKFLDEVGTSECRQKIKDFQTYMFSNEEEAVKYIKVYAEVRGLKFDYVGSIEKAYELAVLEYSFSFWQWGSSCAEIPENPDIAIAVDYLLKKSNISFFSDKEIEELAPHYYQAATEMGYYGYNIQPFASVIRQYRTNPSAVFAPKNAGKLVYSEKINTGLKKWLETKADNIIYIYGGIDTWSATKVIPSPKTNSILLEIKGADHATARINKMNDDLKRKFSNTLEKWLGIQPDFNALK